MTFSLSDTWFKFLHSQFLIYTISWEDVLVDKELLELNDQSNMLMITSAGCNALEYLLYEPHSIHCVDVNPNQTAVLELKLALINQGSYSNFFSFFGDGKSKLHKEVYSRLRSALSEPSQLIWDKSIVFFKPDGRGFFLQGGSGMFARFLNHSLLKKGLKESVHNLIKEPDKNVRETLFEDIEKKLWSGFDQYLWKTSGLLSLAGVPKSQLKAAGDLNGFMREALRDVFVTQHAKNNPYWRLYIEGSYQQEYLPDYLKKRNFELLKNRTNKITFETTNLIDHLINTDSKYSHFVLLDHMDWLVEKHKDLLENQWEAIISNSSPNAKILFRTAHSNIDFISNVVKEKIEFTHVSPEWLSTKDRVGTYTGTYLGIVK